MRGGDDRLRVLLANWGNGWATSSSRPLRFQRELILVGMLAVGLIGTLLIGSLPGSKPVPCAGRGARLSPTLRESSEGAQHGHRRRLSTSRI